MLSDVRILDVESLVAAMVRMIDLEILIDWTVDIAKFDRIVEFDMINIVIIITFNLGTCAKLMTMLVQCLQKN